MPSIIRVLNSTQKHTHKTENEKWDSWIQHGSQYNKEEPNIFYVYSRFLKIWFCIFFSRIFNRLNPHNSRSLDYDINLKFAYKPFLSVDRALQCKSGHTSRQKLGYI